MKKHKFELHMKISSLILTGMMVSVCTFGAGYFLDNSLQNTILNNYTTQQTDIVEREIRHIKEAYEKNKKIDLDATIVSYLQEESNSVNNYWYVYTQDQVLFERDAMQTALLEDKGLDALLQEYHDKGGLDVYLIESLFKGDKSNVVASKASNGDLELLSAQRFELNGKEYVVGNAVNQAMLLKTNSYPIMRIAVFASLAVLDLLIWILLICLIRMMLRNRQSKQEEEVQHYKTEITRMEQELVERRKQVKNDQILDPLRLFYNREYFYTLLLNMTRQNLKALGLIVLETSALHDFIQVHGLDGEQLIFQDLKTVIASNIKVEHVVSRVQSNRIVIVVLNDNYRLMSEDCNSLENAIQQLQLPVSIQVYSIIQMTKESPMDMYKRADHIISMN